MFFLRNPKNVQVCWYARGSNEDGQLRQSQKKCQKVLSVGQITKVGLFSLFYLFDDRRLKVEMLMLFAEAN
jgi:hypothetical protein